MTRLPDQIITGGLQALYGDTPYSLNSDAALQGKSPGNKIGWFPGASLFYHQRLTEDISAGSLSSDLSRWMRPARVNSDASEWRVGGSWHGADMYDRLSPL
jgi:hypothetical protein